MLKRDKLVLKMKPRRQTHWISLWGNPEPCWWPNQRGLGRNRSSQRPQPRHLSGCSPWVLELVTPWSAAEETQRCRCHAEDTVQSEQLLPPRGVAQLKQQQTGREQKSPQQVSEVLKTFCSLTLEGWRWTRMLIPRAFGGSLQSLSTTPTSFPSPRQGCCSQSHLTRVVMGGVGVHLTVLVWQLLTFFVSWS